MPDAPLCVYCRQRPAADPFRPFCSERCKMADLGRWLTGGYRLPAGLDEFGTAPDDPDDDGERSDDGSRHRR